MYNIKVKRKRMQTELKAVWKEVDRIREIQRMKAEVRAAKAASSSNTNSA